MKSKWTRFYTNIAAGTVVAGSLIASNKMAKKYGQKPNQDKLFNINLYSAADYAIKKFMAADDEKIQKIMSLFIKNKDVPGNTSAQPDEITVDVVVDGTDETVSNKEGNT